MEKNEIKKIIFLENENLRFSEVEKYFKDKESIINVTLNGSIDFSIISNIIDSTELKPNIYGILTNNNKGIWDLKYIGQSKSKHIKSRLKQHLAKKHALTRSQLEKVFIEIESGNLIGIKLFAVFPDELRQYYEQKLITNLNPSWNIQN